MTRFEAMVRRKEDEARRATIAGFVTEVDRSAAQSLERLGTEWTRRLFDGPFFWTRARDGRSINLVFVQSREGNTVADDPAELGGGETDKHLVYEGLSRAHADAVLAGAHTALASADLFFSVWHPQLVALRASLGKPRHPAQVVVSTRRERIQGSLLFDVPEGRPILITVDSGADAIRGWASERPWITVISTGATLDLRVAVERLASELQIRCISAIGGRTLAASLLDARLVNDLYLTTSPRSGGQAQTPLYANAPVRQRLVVRKHGKGPEAGVRFEHFVLG